MRQTLQSHLPGTAVIHTATDTTDGQGGYTQAFAAASTVAARLAPTKGDERIMAGRLAEVQQYTLTVPDTTTVAAANRVVYGGVTYEVASVMADVRAPWDLCIRALVTRVD